MASKPIHMEPTPDTLRAICRRQLVGRTARRVNKAQKYSSRTDGMPRNSTICARLACWSDASFTQAPMAANMGLARSIHNDCIYSTGIRGNGHPSRESQYYTPLPGGFPARLARNQRLPRAMPLFIVGVAPISSKDHLARNRRFSKMKRIVLFLMTNFAVLLVLSATMNVLGVGRYITAQGLDLTQLLIFAAIVGFTGSIISLLISKPMAKASTGAQVIDPQAPANAREAWILDTVHQLADRAGIGRPEVAIYDGAPNAFATGAFKNDAL